MYFLFAFIFSERCRESRWFEKESKLYKAPFSNNIYIPEEAEKYILEFKKKMHRAFFFSPYSENSGYAVCRADKVMLKCLLINYLVN